MKEPKGLIEVINDKCCKLYKNGMSEEEISEKVGIPVIRVREAIHGKLIDNIGVSDVAYEYEESNTNTVSVMWKHDARVDRLDELKEVYAKAKAFNEISDVIKKAEFYDRDTALDIIEIVEDLEEKQND